MLKPEKEFKYKFADAMHLEHVLFCILSDNTATWEYRSVTTLVELDFTNVDKKQLRNELRRWLEVREENDKI